MHVNNKYPVLVIIGPSGAGKSTIIKKLYDEGLIIINPTWTTRPPRPGELDDGIEHYFATENEFKENQKNFVETIQMFGLPYSYGLMPVEPSKKDKVSLVMLRASLLPAFSKHYDNYIIYQIEDNLDNVKRRLLDREKHGEAMGTRLQDFENEVKAGRDLANKVFVNNDLDILLKDIKEAIEEDFKNK